MVIITAASHDYFPFLVNMIGSVHKHNFSDLKKLLIYDLGLKPYQVDFLKTVKKLEVRQVRPFVPHWRQWFTWKPYCIQDAMSTEPHDLFLWLDAGTEILSDIKEIFSQIDRDGYFFVGLESFRTNAVWTAKECFETLGLDPVIYGPKNQIGAFCMGFKKSSRYHNAIVKEAFHYCQIEKAIAPQPSCPNNRHDQSIFSLLAAKENCQLQDWEIYGEWREIVSGKHQVIYSCRRKRPFANFAYLKHVEGQSFSKPSQWWPIYREMFESLIRFRFNHVYGHIPGRVKQVYRYCFPIN